MAASRSDAAAAFSRPGTSPFCGIHGVPAAAPFPAEALAGNAAVAPEDHARDAARYFNNRKLSIFGGSNEIQRNILTKAMLEL